MKNNNRKNFVVMLALNIVTKLQLTLTIKIHQLTLINILINSSILFSLKINY